MVSGTVSDAAVQNRILSILVYCVVLMFRGVVIATEMKQKCFYAEKLNQSLLDDLSSVCWLQGDEMSLCV